MLMGQAPDPVIVDRNNRQGRASVDLWSAKVRASARDVKSIKQTSDTQPFLEIEIPNSTGYRTGTPRLEGRDATDYAMATYNIPAVMTLS